ncbi:MAG TPA: hypothetical protein VK030_05150, partial [Actinomycetales bacterium]|nr:hypothetical protein [Actinomycetales bacterium]
GVSLPTPSELSVFEPGWRGFWHHQSVLRKSFALMILSAVALTTACNLRIDTDPDAGIEVEVPPAEAARADAYRNIVGIEAALDANAEMMTRAEMVEDQARAIMEALTTIKENCGTHRELLGSAPEDLSEGQGEADTFRDIQQLLYAAAAANLTQVEASDPEFARLVGAIAADQIMGAKLIEQALAVGSEDGDADEPEAEQDKSAAQEAIDAIPSLLELDNPDPQWAPVIEGFDRMGYLLEIAAARSEKGRESLYEDAEIYRATAAKWADHLGIAGASTDPREVGYATPDLTGVGPDDVAALQDAVRHTVEEMDFMLGDLLFELPADQRATAVIELVALQSESERWAARNAQVAGLREHGFREAS